MHQKQLELTFLHQKLRNPYLLWWRTCCHLSICTPVAHTREQILKNTAWHVKYWHNQIYSVQYSLSWREQNTHACLTHREDPELTSDNAVKAIRHSRGKYLITRLLNIKCQNPLWCTNGISIASLTDILIAIIKEINATKCRIVMRV